MGKQGPCCHCNISTTPLWRNGPLEKPVLCNACGSRWRTKGTLLNYMPMHSGGFGGAGGHEGSGETKCARGGRKGAQKQSSEACSHKRKEPCGPHKSLTLLKWKESVTSDVQSSSQSVSLATTSKVWGSLFEGTVPTKKRTLLSRARAPLEKVARHLLELVYEPPASNPFTTSCVSSEALLVEYNPPFADFEVGLGSIFLNRPPTSSHHEPGGDTTSVWYESLEGSEPFDALNQVAETRISGPLTQLPNGGAKNLLDGRKEKLKQITSKLEGGSHLHVDRNMTRNKTLLENFPYDKRDILQSSQSPLVFLEMKDIVNFETFTGLLTEEEPTRLMKFLSSVDLARFPDSLKEMFNSTQFEGVFANFQHLLSEGIFDSAELGLNPRVFQHFQQLLNVTNLSGSGWLERCSQLQHRSKCRGKSADLSKAAQIKESSKENMKEFRAASVGSAGLKHYPAQLPGQTCGVTGEDLMSHTASQKHKGLAGNLSPLSNDGALVHGGFALGKHPHCLKMSTHDSRSSELDAGETCFLGDGLLLADRRCGEGSISVDDIPDIQVPGSDGTESDLLFHVPSNMMSFQQAELLQQPTCKAEINSNQVENGSLIMSNTWHMDSSPSDWGSLFYNPSCAGEVSCTSLPNGTVLNLGHNLL